MSPRLELQLERLVDEAVKLNNHQALEAFLQDERNEHINPKCSKQFINKLDKLINKELDKGNIKYASLGLTCLHIFGRTLTTQNGQGLGGFIGQGLIKKMLVWFEKAQKFWVEAETHSSEELLNLSEDFMDALLVVHESSKEGNYQVTASFLHHLCQLVAEGQVHILIQKEVIRKLNVILEKIPPVLKKQNEILSSAEIFDVMKKLASRIFKCGDYDLQIALVEALCRMTTSAQRQKLALSWFTMDFVVTAFNDIKDSEFETDCRKFLNLVNGTQGDKRRVYSYPCLEVFLGKHELLMPLDEKLDEFWIDFNLGSHSISFYCSIADEEAEEAQWDTVIILENEVVSYTVKEEDNRKVLNLLLTEPLHLNRIEGSEVFILFSASLNILQAVINVYGSAKHKDETYSQTATPAKMKVSESNTFVSSHNGHRADMNLNSSLLSVETPTSRTKVKSTFKMVKSPERKKAYDIRDLMMAKTSLSISTMRTHCQLRSDQNGKAISSLQKNAIGEDSRFGPTAESFHMHTSIDRMLKMAQPEQECIEEVLGETPNVVPDTQAPEGTKPMRRLSVSAVQLPVQGDFSSGLVTQPVSLPRAVLNDSFKQRTPNEDVQCAAGDVSCQQLHAQLTQRLEELLHQRKQETLPVKNKVSDRQKRNGGKTRRTAGRKEKVQHQGRETPIKPLKPTPVKSGNTVQKLSEGNSEKLLPLQFTSIKNSKEKKTETAVLTGRMASFISNQYKTPQSMQCWTAASGTRSNPEKHWSLTFVEKGVPRHSGFLKSSNQLSTTAKTENDVYSFPVETSKGDRDMKSSECPGIDISSVLDATRFSRAMKKGPTSVKASERYVKKHLFSDTETDNKTDVSWIKESSRKTKPKVADYSRHCPPMLARTLNTTWEAPDLPPPSPKVLEKQAKPKKIQKKRQRKDKLTEKKKTYPVVNRASGRPQRASANFKSYKEPSESDSTSQSETEHRANEAAGKVERNAKVTQQTNGKRKPAATMFQAKGQKESFVCSHPTERMRSGEKPVELLRSPISPLHSLSMFPDATLSPPLEVPTYLKEAKTSSCRTSMSNTIGKDLSLHTFSPVIQKPSSPSLTQSHSFQLKPSLTPPGLSLTQPLPSSTVQEMSEGDDLLNHQLLDDELQKSGNSKGFPASMRKHSVVSMKTPCYSSQKSETANLKMHPSGPCSSLKRCARLISFSTSEAEDQDEEKEKSGAQMEQRGSLKPRKLFKPSRSHSGLGVKKEMTADTDSVGDTEIHSVVSSHMVSSCWEATVEGDMDLELSTPEDLGSVCHQFSSELQRKLQIRSRRMDLYGKQSLNIFQQHLSSINKQIHQYRTQNLKKVKSALLEEIKDLEQDESSLKNVEEDLITYWNKLCQPFHSIKLKGTQRLQHLRSIFSTDVPHSLEFEEQIFKSEMCLMRKDMKSIQDKLFRDMHEEELLSVRRGLQALFLTGRRL